MTRPGQQVFSREIVTTAIKDSFVKLDPRTLVRNPVIFIVELGAVVTTFIFFRDLFSDGDEPLWFTGHDRRLALADSPARQLRRGDRGGPGQSTGERAARHPHDHGRSPPHGEWRARGRRGARPPARRHRRSCPRVRSFPPTARSSRASARSTSPRSRASRRRSSGRPAATARQSPAARDCSRTGSSSR